MGGACSAYGGEAYRYRVLVGKPEAKRPIGRPRRRWEDNIKIECQEVGCWSVDWIELAQDRNRSHYYCYLPLSWQEAITV
jgi:hypothetical protein